ncbi:MAG: dihydropteroate synthase [Candidatus Omnitrophota bacterium]
MIIVGERINSSRQDIARAIKEKDKIPLQKEAMLQAEAGAAFIDVNCAMSMEREPEDMCWLVEVVQSAVDLPLCIDSINPAALGEALKIHKGTAIINSITAEEKRINGMLPLVEKYNALIIALTMDEGGMPSDVKGRIKLVNEIITKANKFGISKDRIFIDPLVKPISTEADQAAAVLSSIHGIKVLGLRTICGLSNISYGLPKRTIINATMLTLAISAGLDAVIIDPLDKNIKAAMFATEAILGRDEYCLNFIQAVRNRSF